MVRPDGGDTGLAITPHLEQGGDGQVVEKPGAWGVTHARSGALIDGPYQSIAQAQGLATELSALPWAASRVADVDVAQAKQIINHYRQSLPEKGG